MMNLTKGLAVAAVLALPLGMASTANAAPLSANPVLSGTVTSASSDLTQQVRWRGHRGGHWHGHRGGGWGGVGAGLAAGALIGGAIAASQAPYGYYGPGYAPGPAYVEGDAVSYCMQRFKSYDPRSGTYLGYDGLRHPCP
ncbi:BA14K family protein [Afipia carboxidovorans]|uniref:BA14K family protein n=1 Tax=Afipia carboxidovorans TaxID=40137 RepID=UPI003088A961|nr:hypothetical protein CRBSH125_34220 [Afipia carboxidovorans]